MTKNNLFTFALTFLFISCNLSNSKNIETNYCKKFLFEDCKGESFFDTIKENRSNFKNDNLYWRIIQLSDSTYEIYSFYFDKNNIYWSEDKATKFTAKINKNRKLYFNETNDPFFGLLKRSIFICKNIDIEFFEYKNRSSNELNHYSISYNGNVNNSKLQGELHLPKSDTIKFKNALDDCHSFQSFLVPKFKAPTGSMQQ